MTTFAAQVNAWSEKAKRNAELVARASIQDVGELMSIRQASITETGTFEIGKVPVDTGELINSQEVSINGSVVAFGDVSYAAVVAGLDLGDSIEAVFTAPHARFMEYGFTTRSGSQVPGRFFVRQAVQQWQTIVDANADLFGDA